MNYGTLASKDSLIPRDLPCRRGPISGDIKYYALRMFGIFERLRTLEGYT